jgi:hypothetical protein
VAHVEAPEGPAFGRTGSKKEATFANHAPGEGAASRSTLPSDRSAHEMRVVRATSAPSRTSCTAALSSGSGKVTSKSTPARRDVGSRVSLCSTRSAISAARAGAVAARVAGWPAALPLPAATPRAPRVTRCTPAIARAASTAASSSAPAAPLPPMALATALASESPEPSW